jgi:hypothetical protein
MAKAPDQKLLAILEEYGETPREAMWDCHGTWVIYHRAIERIAAKAKISFDMPEIVEARSADKIVAIIARGFMGDRSEWSFGEASPGNCKNAYPYAMAEKRAKDRVVLKLVGLHGLAYSEEESDDFKGEPEKPKRQVGINQHTGAATAHSLKKDIDGPEGWNTFLRELEECQTTFQLNKLKLAWSAISDTWPKETAAGMPGWKQIAIEEIRKRQEIIINGLPEDDEFPGDRPSRRELSQHPINAG